jgi:hypothetical protein
MGMGRGRGIGGGAYLRAIALWKDFFADFIWACSLA